MSLRENPANGLIGGLGYVASQSVDHAAPMTYHGSYNHDRNPYYYRLSFRSGERLL